MIYKIYITIIMYFLIGAVGFYLINRKKSRDVNQKSWIKYGTYFLIINVLFLSIVINSIAFRFCTILIIVISAFELFTVFKESGYAKTNFFVLYIILFYLFSISFYWFSALDANIILFTFLILSIFDSFSQISGQLFGRKKLLPKVSPNKTLGGLIGGMVIAIVSAFLLKSLYPIPNYKLIITTFGIILFAFIGDIGASYFKRVYKVKDYSNLIPGHGGFLDRFDSLIAVGGWVLLIQLINF
mgnify:FL=1